MIGFYYVDEDYIKYLKKIENKVPDIKYNSNTKFVCGIVLQINGYNYYAPISHNVTQYRTSMIIKGRKGNAISSIRFSFMFPVPTALLTRLDFVKIAITDKNYANLLVEEYNFCVSNEKQIQIMASKVYQMGCNPNHVMYKNCCNFKELEKISTFFKKHP